MSKWHCHSLKRTSSAILNWHSYERRTEIFLKDLLRRYHCFSFIYFFFQILSAGVCFRISSREFWTEVIILWQYVYIWPQRHTPRICNKNSDYVIMAIRFLIYKKDLIHVLFLTFLVSGKSCVFSRCKVLVKRCQNPYGSMASFKYWYWQLKIHYFI